MEAFYKWHVTRLGHLIFGLVALIVAYAFASLAIDTGSLWQYAATFLFLSIGVRDLLGIFRHK